MTPLFILGMLASGCNVGISVYQKNWFAFGGWLTSFLFSASLLFKTMEE